MNLIPIPNKARWTTLFRDAAKCSQLMEKSIMRNVKCPSQCHVRKQLLQFGTITRYMWRWEIDEINLKIKRSGNVENKNNFPANIRFLAKTPDIRIFSQNIRSGNTESQLLLWSARGRQTVSQQCLFSFGASCADWRMPLKLFPLFRGFMHKL